MGRKKVCLLSGLPGSGKSSWSREQVQHGAIIVDKDSIRRMIHSAYIWDPNKEPVVDEMSHQCLGVALKSTDYIIVDETFLTKESRDAIICEVAKHTRDFDLYVLVFPETGDNLKYRMHDARGYSKEKWAAILDGMREKYEAPDILEEDIDFLYKMPVDFEKRKSILDI
jgi:tRNA uridine 5-carbamoylmethylation protein Kti12